MCDPSGCLRRCFSCHGGGGICCPRPCCYERSRSMDLRNCRCVFPGEYQKFSDMITPSFLLKDPKPRKKREKTKCRPQKCREDKECKQKSDSAGCENECKLGDKGPCDNGFYGGPEVVPGVPICPGELGFPGIPQAPVGLGIQGCPGVPVIPGAPEGQRIQGHQVPVMPEGPGCSEVQGTPGGLGNCVWFQPSDFPCGTAVCCGPGGNPMIFSIPPPNPYGCFGVPGPMGCSVPPPVPGPMGCSVPPPANVAPRDPQRLNGGIPAAGLPTKRVPQFDPCTGQIFQCENPPMGVGNSNQAAQGPSYNQFLQGLNMGFGPLSPYFMNNAGDGPVGMSPEQLPRVPEANSSDCQGKVPGEGPVANQHHQYNPNNFVEHAMYPRQVPQQNPSDGCEPESQRSKSQGNRNQFREDPRSNQHHRFNPTNFEEEATDPRQGVHSSRSQRKRNESREDPRVNQHFREEPMDPRRVPHQNPGACQESQGVHRSRSQRNRNESRGDRTNQHIPYNSPNLREEPMDSRQVSQRNVNRSKSQGHRNESREDPRHTQHNRYNPYPHNFRGEPMNPRSPGNQVSQGASRSKSPGKRATNLNKQCQCPSNFGDGPMNPRQGQRSKSSADQGHHGDGRSRSSRKRNESRECPPEKLPDQNLYFYPQSVGMSYGPSNQCYVADCPLPDPIYVTQVESTWSESQPGEGRSDSPKRRNESKGGTSSRRRRKEESKREPRSKERDQPTEGAPLNQPIHTYGLRFEPTNQFYPYYDCYPPPAEKSRLRTSKSRHDFASNDCPEPLNRITESCSSDDLQRWSHRLMAKSKKKSASAAKGSRRAKSKSSSTKISPRKTSAKKVCNPNCKNMDGKSAPAKSATVVEPQEIPAGQQEKSGPQEAEATPAPSCKPEMVSCSCYANLPEKTEETTDKDGQQAPSDPGAACPNNCWVPCPSPWSGCCSPCNGYYYYRTNCCNGCRNCRNYCCNPCGRYCCSRPPSTSPPKPRDTGGGVGKTTMKRYPGGAAVSGPGYFCLRPQPELGYPIPSMPGYLPTAPPHCVSPYSGRCKVGEVVTKQRPSGQNPMNISCMRH